MPNTTVNQRIGFIGAGQMARALANGIVASGQVASERIVAYDPLESTLSLFRSQVSGAGAGDSNQGVVSQADTIFVAVKPQVIDAVFSELQDVDTSSKLFVSIVAGVHLERLSSGLRTPRVIRVMPNTPCLIGVGASGFSLGGGATPEDGELVERLLQSVGISLPLPEPLLDVVTGLSGSGPAYIYTIIEALSDGAVRMGLPRDASNQLAVQTVIGAAKMVQSTSEHPAVLKERVASPGGTTIAGLQAMEDGRIRSVLMAAVQAATLRSIELGNRAE